MSANKTLNEPVVGMQFRCPRERGELFCLLTLGIVFAGGPQLKADERTDYIRKLEQQAIDYRKQMNAVKVVWKTNWPKYVQQPVYERMPEERTIWAKDDKLRCDLRRKTLDNREHITQKVITPDLLIHNYDDRGPVDLYTDKKLRPLNPAGDPYHPRLLGMFPWTVQSLEQFELGALFTRKDRQIIEIIRERDVGANLWKVTSKPTESRSTLTSWIDPEKGPSITRLKIMGSSGGNTGQDEVQVEYAKFGNAGIWYPARVSYRRTENGKLTFHEDTVTLAADFDSDIANDTFRLAGLDLPAGREVTVDVVHPCIWDGKQLISAVRPPNKKKR
jgi:hypothetical protein